MKTDETLKSYCAWMTGENGHDNQFPDLSPENVGFNWYDITYPLRTLLKASVLLEEPSYAEVVFKYMDIYVGEQLPQGGFTADYRGTPTSELDAETHRDVLRSGKVNLADNGSNVTCLVQAAAMADPERRERYLAAAKRWFEEWVPIWALAENAGGCCFWTGKHVPPDNETPALKRGIYGNGIWGGHKVNTPYTMAICNVATAFAAYHKATGDVYYRDEAEACAKFLCKYWGEDGLPLNLSVYPLPRREMIDDYGRIFYLMEGLCWAHSVSDDNEVKSQIERRLKEWLHAPSGVLSRWQGSWFDFNRMCDVGLPEYGYSPIRSSKIGIRLFWEMAKATAIPHLLAYYSRNIEDDPEIKEKVELGVEFLLDPGKARMTGIMSDSAESYGKFALQATGFGGLSLVEAIAPGTVFSC